MIKRSLVIFALVFLLLGGLLTVGGNSAGGTFSGIVIMNDGQVIVGQPFLVDEQNLSVLTDQGMRTLPRAAVHSLTFLTPATLVLRAEGTFTKENRLEGKIFYVGGLLDGRQAGTFVEVIAADPNNPDSGQLTVRTTHTLSDGSTLADWSICNCKDDRPVDGVLTHQLAGVITAGTGRFEYAQGTSDSVIHINTAQKPATIGYFIFHFRKPIDP
jgi:hypothetical protein